MIPKKTSLLYPVYTQVSVVVSDYDLFRGISSLAKSLQINDFRSLSVCFEEGLTIKKCYCFNKHTR